MEIKDENKVKKYVCEIIKKVPLIQKEGFWIGLTNYEINEEILKEKNQDNMNKNNSLFTNFNLLNKRKKDDIQDIQLKICKNVVAKLMSISYNLIQFILDSDNLNQILARIFRNFKISKENKEMLIGMMKAQIESEGIKNLKINEAMLLKCDKIECIINDNGNKEIIENKDEKENNEIINDKIENKEIIDDHEEKNIIINDKKDKNEIIYDKNEQNEVNKNEKKESQNAIGNDFIII